jgi:hypothetical protein
VTDLVDAARNLTLNELASNITHISLHSAFPGTGGTSELTGGSPAYARKAVTWGAAASGVLTTSVAPAAFDVPAGATVGFAGFWSAITAGTFLGSIPLGPVGDPQLATAATSGAFTAPGHTFSDGDSVVVLKTYGALPTGTTEGSTYWVRDVSGDTFKLAASSGGAAITISAAGRAAVQEATFETYGGQGTYTISSISVAIP